MAKKGSFSKVYDKNGDYADVEAVRFDGTRTVQMQGDVAASQTWNGDPSSPLTLNASIGAKKVTQDKIGDKAVGSGQMADGSVGLTQIAASAMTDTVAANNSKLVTSQGVNAAIAAATLNRGKDYGPMSVDEINAISETIPTGSTVYVESLGASDAKVINDGYSDGTMASFSVEVGEDLKYYRAPDNSLHGWYSTEANVKIKQPANYSGGIAVDSAQDASSGSAGIEFIQSFKQNTNGDIRDIVKAQVDIVDSTSSTRTDAVATPNSVKSAYDLANTANTGAVKNVAYDSTNKKITKTINGQTTDVVSADTLKTDMALNKVDNTSDVNKPVSTAQQAALDLKLDKTGDGKDVTVSFSEASARENIGTGEKLSVMFGKIKKWFTDLKALAFKDTVSDSDISGTISDSHIASASTWNGKADKVSGATNGNLAALDSNGNLTDSGKKASDFELGTNKISSWQSTPDNTHYPSEKLVKDSLDAKVDIANIDLDGKTTTILAEVQALATKGIHYARFYTRGDGGAANISDKPVSGSGFLCEVLCNRFSGTTNYRYLVTCWVGEDKNPYWTYVKSDVASITWSRLNAYVPGAPTNNNLVAMDANGLVKNSGVAVLPSTSTWDGTSDAKVPTAKAVQAKLDGKQDSLPTSGTASSTYAINISGKSADATNWSGQISGLANFVSTKKYVYIGRKTKPVYGCLIGMLTVCSHTNSKDVYVIGSGWSSGNFGYGASVQRISSGGTDASIKICLYNHEVTENGTTYSELWCCIPTDSGEADFVFRQLFNYNDEVKLATGIVNRAESEFTGTLTKCANSDSRNIAFSPTNTVKGSTSVPVYVKESGEIAACTDTFVNDIAYVANQSGGGGSLNKTINGTPTSVLTFMNDSEAVAIWADAKTAAANAS